MKLKIGTVWMTVLVLGAGAAMVKAQNSPTSLPLGDLARKLKTERAKPKEKPKVFTNDDLATLPPLSAPPASSPAAPANTSEGKAEATHPTEGRGNPAGEQSGEAAEEGHGEKYFRGRMSSLESRLEIDQRELSVLQQKLGQGEMLYYPDPNKGLLQQSGATAMSDVNDLRQQIANEKADIAADQQAIEDLQQQLRRAGGDPGWLRNVSASQPAEGGFEKPAGKPGTREYWQSRFKSARARLDGDRKLQQLSEDELNLLQIQDVRELNSSAKAELDAKVAAKQDEVSRNRAAAEQAEKALGDLENEFKASGAPEEWKD